MTYEGWSLVLEEATVGVVPETGDVQIAYVVSDDAAGEKEWVCGVMSLCDRRYFGLTRYRVEKAAENWWERATRKAGLR